MNMLSSMRGAVVAAVLSLVLLLAGCGGEQGGQAPTATAVAQVTQQPTAMLPAPTSMPTALPTAVSTATAVASSNTPGAVDRTADAARFIDLLVKGDFAGAEAQLDAAMQAMIPQQKLAEIWQQLVAQAGPFRSVRGAKASQLQGYDVIVTTVDFQNAPIDVQLSYDKAGRIAGMYFRSHSDGPTPTVGYSVPSYVDTSLFTEQEVKAGSGEWVLPGTLTLPKGSGPFPGVVLVQGSGPHDRDETVGPNKPFRDLAWGLASQGIAVLRYDKRTKVYPQKAAALLSTLTIDWEVTDDAVAAVHLLQGTGKIDKDKVFVLGHSLGAMDAPRVAQRVPGLAGLIIMGGPTRPLEDVMLDQYTYLASAEGTPTPDQQKQLDDAIAQVAQVKSLYAAPGTPIAGTPLGMPGSYWLDLRGYSPADVARGLPQPILVLQAEADYQVTMKDFTGWQDALQAKSNATLKRYPGLYHLFMKTQHTKSVPADYQVPGHVDPAVVSDIAQWIKKQ